MSRKLAITCLDFYPTEIVRMPLVGVVRLVFLVNLASQKVKYESLSAIDQSRLGHPVDLLQDLSRHHYRYPCVAERELENWVWCLVNPCQSGVTEASLLA